MRAFVLGNSGELLDHNLDLLKGEAVFGTNALPLFKPEIITHYVCLDIGMAFVPEVRALVPKTARKFYSRFMWNTIYQEDGVEVYDTWPDRMTGFEISSEKVFGGQTVTYVCLQIAAALGYDEIYLLGVDLGLPANGIHSIPQQEVLYQMIRDKNLANPTVDKRGGREKTHEEFNKPVIKNFLFARHALEKAGIKVFNLSKGGNLNCFPRKTFEEVLGDKQYVR